MQCRHNECIRCRHKKTHCRHNDSNANVGTEKVQSRHNDFNAIVGTKKQSNDINILA